jgi:catechol 2,3-dioxygenase-like lactoylglutathione lyase family enzyme
MEHFISDLLTRFERGGLTRRELVQALAMVVVAGRGATAAGLQAGSINHVSVLVNDMPRSTDFYQRVFGLSLVNEDKPHQIARLGAGGKVLVSLRKEPPAGMVDHFAIGVENFNKDAVTRELTSLGHTPHENLEYGFYVDDPDGVHVQITAI